MDSMTKKGFKIMSESVMQCYIRTAKEQLPTLEMSAMESKGYALINAMHTTVDPT